MEFEHFLSDNVERADRYIASFFKQKGSHPDMQRYLYTPLANYAANGGKRHRPLICQIACEAVGGSARVAMAAAAAIEHFHTAALIHDDIADEALLRRGEPCMHIREGVGLAINAGDLALSLVTGSVLRDTLLPDAVKLRVLNELVDMTTRTVEGQALDIGWARDNRFDLSIEDYLVMARHKTAYYSGGVPLAVGAIIGGGTEDQIEGLRKFGLETGLAFQIQDDLLNLVGTEEATKKDFRNDITEGKRTLITVHAFAHSPQKDALIEILSAHSTDPAVLEDAVRICKEAGSIDYAHSYALSCTVRAKEHLCATLPDTPQRELMLSMADYFVERMK